MNFTHCVTCTSHILLPIGSLQRSRNELSRLEEAGITRMFCCHWDNGGVYHRQRLGGERVRAGCAGEGENTVYKERLR